MNKIICFIFCALLSNTLMAASDDQWITCTYQHQYKYREIDYSNSFEIDYYMRNFTRTNSSRPWVEMVQPDDLYVGLDFGGSYNTWAEVPEDGISACSQGQRIPAEAKIGWSHPIDRYGGVEKTPPVYLPEDSNLVHQVFQCFCRIYPGLLNNCQSIYKISHVVDGKNTSKYVNTYCRDGKVGSEDPFFN